MEEESPQMPIKLEWKSGLEWFEAVFEQSADMTMGSVEGNLTGVVQSADGQVLALVLDNKTLVRVPMSLRGAPKAGEGTGATNVTQLEMGASIGVTGWSKPPVEGAISSFPERFLAQRITVNRRKVETLGFIPPKRQNRVLNRSNEIIANGVREAESEGLEVYEPPLAAGSRILVRGNTTAERLRSVGIEPPLETVKRPW